ncbi:MAG: hypothetical protein ACK5JT_12870 [Hyphomicrobiaceae bacterium]
MSPTTQKYLAIIGAIIGVAVFIAANTHLLIVAINSQPACSLADTPHLPAKRAC